VISASGSIIQTDGGGTYAVLGGDRSTASSWSVGDDVLVCDGKMVNKDDGEEIEVSRQ
jgi:hypothetical protein